MLLIVSNFVTAKLDIGVCAGSAASTTTTNTADTGFTPLNT